MKNLITTAKRSALLSSTDTNGQGVRPGVERTQSTNTGIKSQFDLDTFSRAKLEAFKQSPDTEVTVGKLGIALVVKDSPWSAEQPFTADLGFPIDDQGEMEWVAFVAGEEIWINEADVVNGFYTIGAKLVSGDIVEFEFDPNMRWFMPVVSAGLLVMPQTRQMITRIAA